MNPNSGEQQYDLSGRLDDWNGAIVRAQREAIAKQIAQDEQQPLGAGRQRPPAGRPLLPALVLWLRRRTPTASTGKPS